MATANVTVTLDPVVLAAAKRHAAAANLAMSAWVAKAIRDATTIASARLCDEYDRAHPQGAAEMAGWDAQRDDAHQASLRGAQW